MGKQSKSVVLYDGECGFCLRAVERLRRLDSRGRLEFVALQAADVPERFPGLDAAAMRARMHLVWPDGRAMAGADAYRAICALVPRLRPVAALWWLPGFPALARAVYAWVARNRDRLGGGGCGSPACRIHHPPRRAG